MDNLILGLEIMVIGFTVVMITLYLLYLILLGFSRVCNKPAKPETSKSNPIAVPPVALQETATAPVAATVSQQSLGTAPEIVAAITAAISACLGTSTSQFEIVSVQPVRSTTSGSEWSVAGRKRLMEKRQDLAMFRRERK